VWLSGPIRTVDPRARFHGFSLNWIGGTQRRRDGERGVAPRFPSRLLRVQRGSSDASPLSHSLAAPARAKPVIRLPSNWLLRRVSIVNLPG
jgi:hypothetical protein